MRHRCTAPESHAAGRTADGLGTRMCLSGPTGVACACPKATAARMFHESPRAEGVRRHCHRRGAGPLSGAPTRRRGGPSPLTWSERDHLWPAESPDKAPLRHYRDEPRYEGVGGIPACHEGEMRRLSLTFAQASCKRSSVSLAGGPRPSRMESNRCRSTGRVCLKSRPVPVLRGKSRLGVRTTTLGEGP